MLILSSASIASTSYFYGKLKFYKLDGTFDFEKESLVKRELHSNKKEIKETTTQKPDSPTDPIDRVTLISFKNQNHFEVQDLTTNSFSGSMYFSENLSEWIYDIKLSNGKLSGVGQIDEDGNLITSKQLTLNYPDFQFVRNIKEKLIKISKKEYKKIYKGIADGSH
jgi:hypothetical protein